MLKLSIRLTDSPACWWEGSQPIILLEFRKRRLEDEEKVTNGDSRQLEREEREKEKKIGVDRKGLDKYCKRTYLEKRYNIE